MRKPWMFALLATLVLPVGAHAQDASLYSSPSGATLRVTHDDGNVDTTTCSSGAAGVYCHSYTTTVEADLIGHALDAMLPPEHFDDVGGSIGGALKVLPDALKDSMRETCASLGFWKQRKDPYCNPMAQIDAAMNMTDCLGSASAHLQPSRVSEATCAAFYDRAFQQYVKNLARNADSQGYPVIYRLKPKDEVLREYAPTFLPIALAGDGKQFPNGYDELKHCLGQFRNADDLATDPHCAALYNRAVDRFNERHKGSALTYTKVALQ